MDGREPAVYRIRSSGQHPERADSHEQQPIQSIYIAYKHTPFTPIPAECAVSVGV